MPDDDKLTPANPRHINQSAKLQNNIFWTPEYGSIVEMSQSGHQPDDGTLRTPSLDFPQVLCDAQIRDGL
jgi:hypothetical protein